MQTRTVPIAPELAEQLARYDTLAPAEGLRCARLVALTGAPLGLAVAAIEATRRHLAEGRPVEGLGDE